jgi:hypothetical protein
LTDSHVKLNILVDSHHKIAFDYNEDTMSLVEELTLTKSEYFSPTTPIPLLGTHPQPLNTISMRLRLTHFDLITIGQRSRILN